MNEMNTCHPQIILLSEYIISWDRLQLIDSHTRITNHSATLIDIFLVSTKEIVKSATVVDLGISDHSAISLHLSWRKPKPLPLLIECRSFEKFKSQIETETVRGPLDSVRCFDDIDDKLDYFNKVFSQVLNEHAAVRKIRVKKNGSPWVT